MKREPRELKKRPEHEEIPVPECDMSDPGSLEAWYGPFGFFEHWHEVVESNCYEIERARAVLEGESPTEAQLKNRARTNQIYRNFLTVHLNGRRIRESNVRASYGR